MGRVGSKAVAKKAKGRGASTAPKVSVGASTNVAADKTAVNYFEG